MDVTPLRESRDFRLLFTAGTVFYLGGMVSYVAIPFQIYDLTGSNFLVGAVGLVELVPLIVFGLYGGALADHVDRRRLLIGSGLAQLVLMAVLAANSFLAEPSIPLIFVVAALLAATSSLQRPSREALEPRTVRHDQITAANALSSFGMQVGVLVGPAIGGVLIAWVGIGWCFVVDVVALAVACAAVRRDAALPPPRRDHARPACAGSRRAGATRSAGATCSAPTSSTSPPCCSRCRSCSSRPWRPRSSRGPSCSGCSTPRRPSARSLATALSGWTSHVHHHGRAIVIAATAYGACIALAGLAPSFGVALVCFAMAGRPTWSPPSSAGPCGTRPSPSTCAGGWPASRCCPTRSGRWAARCGRASWPTPGRCGGRSSRGGVACVAGVLLTAALLRDFWSYDNRTDEHAVAERERRAAAAV